MLKINQFFLFFLGLIGAYLRNLLMTSLLLPLYGIATLLIFTIYYYAHFILKVETLDSLKLTNLFFAPIAQHVKCTNSDCIKIFGEAALYWLGMFNFFYLPIERFYLKASGKKILNDKTLEWVLNLPFKTSLYCVIALTILFLIGHPRVWFLVIITGFMGFMFVFLLYLIILVTVRIITDEKAIAALAGQNKNK